MNNASNINLSMSFVGLFDSDRRNDYTPIVSVITNIYQLGIKLLLSIAPEETSSCFSNDYCQIVKNKSTFRQIVLTSPFIGISNLCLFIYDTRIREYYIDTINLCSERAALFKLFESMPMYWRNDKDVVLKAVELYGEAFKYASKELKNDKNFLFLAVKQNGEVLKYASEGIRNDKKFLFMAVKQNREVLKYASEGIRNDKVVVLEVVKHSSWALEYASEALRNDKEVVLGALRPYCWSFQFASESLRNDKEFVLEAVKRDGWALDQASKELRNDKEFLLEAIKQNRDALTPVSKELKSDKKFLLEAVKQNGMVLEYLCKELRNDKEFVLEAVKQNYKALQYASEGLRNDKEFLFEAGKLSEWVLFFALSSFLNEDGEESKLTTRACCILYLEKKFEVSDKDLDVFSLVVESAAKAWLDNPELLKEQEFAEWFIDKRLRIFLDEVIEVMSVYLSDYTGWYASKLNRLEAAMAEDYPQILTQIRDAVQNKRRKQPGFIGKTKDMTFFFK